MATRTEGADGGGPSAWNRSPIRSGESGRSQTIVSRVDMPPQFVEDAAPSSMHLHLPFCFIANRGSGRQRPYPSAGKPVDSGWFSWDAVNGPAISPPEEHSSMVRCQHAAARSGSARADARTRCLHRATHSTLLVWNSANERSAGRSHGRQTSESGTSPTVGKPWTMQ